MPYLFHRNVINIKNSKLVRFFACLVYRKGQFSAHFSTSFINNNEQRYIIMCFNLNMFH